MYGALHVNSRGQVSEIGSCAVGGAFVEILDLIVESVLLRNVPELLVLFGA